MTSFLKDRWWAAVAAIVGFAMTALYVALLMAEGNAIVEWLPWAVSMAVAIGLAFASTHTVDAPVTRKLLIATSAIFAVIGTTSSALASASCLLLPPP